MRQITYNYLGLEEKLVQDKNNFFSSGIPSISKLRNLVGTAQRIFITSSRNVRLYILGDGDSYYKIELLKSNKELITTLYYIPGETRLDVYDSDSSSPLFVWIRKQCMIKNIGSTLSALGIEKQLLPLIANL